MTKLFACACVTAVIALTSITASASSGADDLVRMARSGVDEEVLAAYVDAAPDTFDLSADDIITLKDLGVPSKVISEALRHGHAYESDSAAAVVARETIQAASNATDTTAAQASQVLSTTAAAAPPPDDQNISFFYEALSPYGDWIDIDGTWCWQPNAMVISPDWAPYCRHGHWEYTDWGWCWVSDYSWGWAPFHYGRWLHHRTHGWCWVPDTEWGPAWVAWRRGNGYCGWAPLPPRTRFDNHGGAYFGDSRVGEGFEFNLAARDYFFVPDGNLCDPHPWVHVVPSVRADDVYRRTQFVKNSYGFEHEHIVNRGLPVDEISRASNRQIAPITIVRDDIKPGQPIHRGLLTGNQLVVYKPAIAPAAPRTPAVVKALLTAHRTGVVQPASGIDAAVLKRQKAAAQLTLKDQRLRAENAAQERMHLDKAAAYEADTTRRAELRAESEIQLMKAKQAQDHVDNIKQWKPSAQQKPAVMPQPRVVPQQSAESRGRAQTQVRAQVQNEARMEQQRQPVAEQMIRNHAQQP